MNYNSELAAQLFCTAFNKGMHGWFCANEAVLIAAQCGLGVISIEAKKNAKERIQSYYKINGKIDETLYKRLNILDCSRLWAQELFEAAQNQPTRQLYPIVLPNDHVVGGKGCWKQARKGKWTDECYRAAWGNVKPFGLSQAVKPCPKCNAEMKYWIYGQKSNGWSIDHIIPHSKGGCVCPFNLLAMHKSCNSSKGNSLIHL